MERILEGESFNTDGKEDGPFKITRYDDTKNVITVESGFFKGGKKQGPYCVDADIVSGGGIIFAEFGNYDNGLVSGNHMKIMNDSIEMSAFYKGEKQGKTKQYKFIGEF